MKHKNRFLYVQNLNRQRRLVLPSTFNAEANNFLEIAIAKAHAATACGGIEKTMKDLTDKLKCQSFSCRVREYVESCDVCQWTHYV